MKLLKLFYATTLLIFYICGFSGAQENTAVLEDGTPVVLRLTEEVSTKTKNLNDSVHMEVARDVVFNGKMLIKSGTPADGIVTVCEKPNVLGQEGTLCFMASSTKAVDGQYISLRANLSRSGQDNMLLSASAAYVCCPLFGLIKGGGATFPVGSEFKSYTENNVAIKTS